MKLFNLSALAAVLASSVLLSACNSGESKTDTLVAETDSSISNPDQWLKYENLATQIKQNHNSAPFSELATQASNLTHLSTELLPQFIEQNAECKEYLTVAMDSVETMFSLTLEQIESDYHADGKLPAMNDVKCYHAKDLLVHPATVAVIAKELPESTESREMILDEIAEVLEHLKQVQQASVQK